MKKILTLMLALFSFTLVFAQPSFERTENSCATMSNLQAQLQADPTLQTRMEEIERFTQEYVTRFPQGRRAVIQIPVVFHIVHDGDALGVDENLSETYIMAQLQQMNDDYRKMNSDAGSVPGVFQPLHADTEIEFCLAKVDPNGCATTGINRYNGKALWNKTSWTINFCENTLKPATIWNRDKYLNFWTCVFGGGDSSLLGYAQFPGGTATTDGVVCLWSSVGSIATPHPSGGVYGKGRTATHEVGHWLNLRHIWGDANCGNDQVADTPTQQTSNGGCPAFPKVTCSNGPNGDMWMNYMDYTYDACMYMCRSKS